MTSQLPPGRPLRLHTHSPTTLSRLSASPASIGLARAQVVGFCRRHGFAELEETAALLTSELVTNAVQHGGEPLTLSVSRTPDELRVDVSDGSTDLPQLQMQPVADQPNGRGLMLVDALASSWRCRPRPDGKTVSFTLSTEAAEPAPVVVLDRAVG